MTDLSGLPGMNAVNPAMVPCVRPYESIHFHWSYMHDPLCPPRGRRAPIQKPTPSNNLSADKEKPIISYKMSIISCYCLAIVVIRPSLQLKQQELSYRKQIARQLRTQYVEGTCRSNYQLA